ncbi:MAG: tRNA (N6-threonylcarbamoyladenosine(37)-N6)-methyltransferase TrmO [Candidatus Velamenicoccus archaeovorus]
MKKIIIRPIGIIRTPYKTHKGMPIQGKFKPKVKGKAILLQKYVEGLKDLEGFSHAILLWHIHKSKEERLLTKPFMEDVIHGVFSTRNPHRPNHIGFSIVKIEKIRNNVMTFSEVDMLDGTPLLDIKPYMAEVDTRENVRTGWAQKHLTKGRLPTKAIHGKLIDQRV